MQADFSVELGGNAPVLEIPWRSDDPRVRYYDLKNHPELVQQIPEAIAYPELGAFLLRINATNFPLATAKCDTWSSSEVDPEEEIFGDRKFVSYIDLFFVDERDRCSFEKHEAFAKELCRMLGHAPEIAATVELVIRNCYYHQEKFEADNEAEQSGTRSPAIVRDPGMNPLNNGDTVDRDKLANVPQHEGDNVVQHDDHIRLTKCDEPIISSERRQLGLQESARHHLLDGDDLLKTASSGECGNPGRERNPQWEGPMTEVTGFYVTVYVTGFGDSDHDPVRRWTIALNLLQHAIVQVNLKLATTALAPLNPEVQ